MGNSSITCKCVQEKAECLDGVKWLRNLLIWEKRITGFHSAVFLLALVLNSLNSSENVEN